MIARTFPRFLQIRQGFPPAAALDYSTVIPREMAGSGILSQIRPGARIAVGVGSRGITNLQEIVRVVVQEIKNTGAEPFILPAMGSHGGGTPEGQTGVLAEYGVTPETVGAPIRASMEVSKIGQTNQGIDVFCSVEALRSDGIILINRIKPHTSFSGAIGSGILKMLVLGLGKHAGAIAFHQGAARAGHEHVIRSIVPIVLGSAPVLGGIGLVEDQHHQTASIRVLRPDGIVAGEEALFQQARALLPKLPFEEFDLLIVDRIGKNISGTGMDPNVIGRSIFGYNSSLAPLEKRSPFIRRIFVRDLTPETHGNAIGIGMADITTSRFVRGINFETTYVNALTSTSMQGAKIPLHFETDRIALERILDTLALPSWAEAKIVRIQDTLNVGRFAVSENLLESVRAMPNLEVIAPAAELGFDDAGNML